MARLGALFLLELLALSIWIDNDALRGSSGLAVAIHDWGAWAVRLIVAVAFLTIILGESKKAELQQLSEVPFEREISWLLLLAHVAAMVCFLWLSNAVFVARTGS